MGEVFDRVFRARYGEVVGLATGILGDRAAAEDVAQETLTRLAGHDVLLRPDHEIAAWLRRVAINTSFNRLRGDQRRRRREDAVHRADAAVAEVGDPLATVMRGEQQDAVRLVLAELPERQRTCLVLRHSGYAYREVAETTGLAVGSVGVTLARAERAFRNRWEERMAQDHPVMQPEQRRGADQ
jgi:RNA polymerase sigma factor (sigma-70 family)